MRFVKQKDQKISHLAKWYSREGSNVDKKIVLVEKFVAAVLLDISINSKDIEKWKSPQMTMNRKFHQCSAPFLSFHIHRFQHNMQTAHIFIKL